MCLGVFVRESVSQRFYVCLGRNSMLKTIGDLSAHM